MNEGQLFKTKEKQVNHTESYLLRIRNHALKEMGNIFDTDEKTAKRIDEKL